ncbi:hypothetical protein ACFL96_09610 [Thermoproteota archaeon]
MGEKDRKEPKKPDKSDVTRRSFLKMLGMSLVSHFVFLNLGPKKGWAASSTGAGSEPACNEPITPDQCNQTPGGGSIFDTCSTYGTTGNIDRCGQSGVGGEITDKCNTNPDDQDRCGYAGASGGAISDTCNTSTADGDMCGMNKPTGEVGDTCVGAGNTDKCGWNVGGNIPEDKCGGDGGPDQCGQTNYLGGLLGDATCNPGSGDEDKCGQENSIGGITSDVCDPPTNPDQCGVSIWDPDECHPPEDEDKCKAPGSVGRGASGPMTEAEACERGGPIVTDGESDYEF